MDGFRVFGTVVCVEDYGDLFQPLGTEMVEENKVDWIPFGPSRVEPCYGFFNRTDTKDIEPV